MGGVTTVTHGHRRGLFVTATDTGVGKTVLSASLLASMRAAGERVRAHKPVVTGLDDPAGAPARRQPEDRRRGGAERNGPELGFPAEAWPADHELLAAAAGMEPEQVAPLRFGPAASPKLAAALAGERIDIPVLLERARLAGCASPPAADEITVVEGVGGLLAPFGARFACRDLAAELGYPVLIAARPGLGTINHTLLTLAAARAGGLHVCAVVLTPWPRAPDAIERSNREEIELLGEVEVVVLRRVRGPDLGELERAGRWLPWRRWLGEVPARSREPMESPLAAPAVSLGDGARTAAGP